MSQVFHTSNIVQFLQNTMVVCEVLALSALLATSNSKASAIASAAFSTADNTVPTHNGGTAALWMHNADPKVNNFMSLSTNAVISAVSIVNSPLAVSGSLSVLLSASQLLVGSS